MGRPGGCMSTAPSRKFSQPKRVRRFNFTYRVTLSERKMANRIRHFYSQRRKSVQAFCARKAMSVRIYCKSMFSCMEDVAGVVNSLFSQFYNNRKEGVSHMTRPMENIAKGAKLLGTGIVLAVAANEAKATPMGTEDYNSKPAVVYNASSDTDFLAQTSQITGATMIITADSFQTFPSGWAEFYVYNDSPLGDRYAMGTFILPAGTNQKVYEAWSWGEVAGVLSKVIGAG